MTNKPVSEMTPAEFKAAKARLTTDAIAAEKQAARERATAAIKHRHENPPQPLKVIPFAENEGHRMAPIQDVQSRLPHGRGAPLRRDAPPWPPEI